MANTKKLVKVTSLAPAAGPEGNPVLPVTSKRGRISARSEEEQIEQQRRLEQKRAIRHQFGDPHMLLTNYLKNVIHDLVFEPKFNDLCNINDLLAKKTGYNYRYLSRIFSETEQKTVERFIMEQKVEKVKELVANGNRSLADISFELNYSSVAHLSAQFKMITGITIREYRNRLRQKKGSGIKNHATL